MNDSIAVIMLNWNGWKMTLDAIASLRTTSGASWHVYVVDNASTDESAERLSGLGDDVTLVRADRNLGWTGGNNLGLGQALKDGYSYFFIMNNDALVFPDTLARLMRFYQEHGKHPIVGPVHLTEAQDQYDFIGADTKVSTGLPALRDARQTAFDAIPEVSATDYIRGAGIFTSKVHLDRVGLFDDRFYLNYDETDWCYRAKEAGYELLMLRDARIVHIGSATIGGGWSPLNIYFLVRNSLLFAELHCTPKQRMWHLHDLYYWYRTMTPATSILAEVKLFLRQNAGLSAAFRMGMRDYFIRRFGECPPSIRAMNRSA